MNGPEKLCMRPVNSPHKWVDTQIACLFVNQPNTPNHN